MNERINFEDIAESLKHNTGLQTSHPSDPEDIYPVTTRQMLSGQFSNKTFVAGLKANLDGKPEKPNTPHDEGYTV